MLIDMADIMFLASQKQNIPCMKNGEKWVQRELGNRNSLGAEEVSTARLQNLLSFAAFPVVWPLSQKPEGQPQVFTYSGNTFCAAVISSSQGNKSKWCSRRVFSVPFDSSKYFYFKGKQSYFSTNRGPGARLESAGWCCFLQ